MKYENVIVNLNHEKMDIFVLLKTKAEYEKDRFSYRVSSENSTIDIFDWSQEKVIECVELRLEMFFNTIEIPAYTLLIDME